jgi:hypothetical protein
MASTTLNLNKDVNGEVKCGKAYSLLYAQGVKNLLIGKPEGKRPLGNPRQRWIDNIKMDLLEIELDGLAQDRYGWRALANAARNIRVP